MDKKVFGLLFALILFSSFAFSADIIVPVNPNTNLTPNQEQIQQTQESIQQFGELQSQIDSLTIHINNRTDLLASFVQNKINEAVSTMIVIFIIACLSVNLMFFGLILYLKSKRRW